MEGEHNPNKEQAVRALELAKAALQRKNYDSAIKLLSKAMRLDPSLSEAQRLLAAVQKAKQGPAPRRAEEASSEQSSGGEDDSVTVVRRVLRAESYYEVLGVTRSSSSAQLKKAYRKTSLRVHPDKNRAEGAVAAFQKVTDAYDVLSDERKKEIYDQLGHRQYTRQAQAGGGDPERGAAAGFGGFGGPRGQHVSPEELFNMFFRAQGGMGGAGFSFQPGGPRVRVNRRGGNGGGGAMPPRGGSAWFSWVPLGLLVIMWFIGGAFQESTPYMLSQTRQHHYRRQVISGKESLEYFVDDSFSRRFSSPEDAVAIEMRVWRDYLRHYESMCIQQQREKQQRLFWAFRTERRVAIESEPMVYCEKFERLRSYPPNRRANQ